MNINLQQSNIDPVSYLREAITRWGQKANERELFNFRDISLSETVDLIKCFGNSSSFGDDEIDVVTLKVVAPYIYIPLNHIINLSQTGSCFVNKWCIGRLVPLFKGNKLDRNKTLSYRPISLLPLVAKITEWAAQIQILKFMESFQQLNYNNNAYRKYYNTTAAVMQILDALYEVAILNTIANIITVDESAAFDCISHKILNEKLGLYNLELNTSL